jgi:hypothetical protein
MNMDIISTIVNAVVTVVNALGAVVIGIILG